MKKSIQFLATAFASLPFSTSAAAEEKGNVEQKAVIMIKRIILAGCMVFFSIGINAAWALEQQVIAGAGPSTKIVQLFFDGFKNQPEAKAYEFVIPPRSAKHSGGIKCSDQYVFGRTGRPLNAKEKALNKEEIFLARIPVVLVVGSGVGINSLSLGQLEAIVTGRHTNWKEVGGPDAEIEVIGREETEALFTVLKGEYPFFKSAKFKKIMDRDDQIVNYMKSTHGKYAIAFGAKPNFEEIDKAMMLSIDGFVSGVSVGLVYDQSKKDHPLIKAVKNHVKAGKWNQEIKSAGYLPPNS